MDVSAFIRSQEAHRHRSNPAEDKMMSEVFPDSTSRTARFFVDAFEDTAASELAGYPVFRDIVCIYICCMDRKHPTLPESQTYHATSEHRTEYPREWELFLKNHETRKIPLNAIPQLTPATTKTFEAMGLRSVEDVVAKQDMPDDLKKYQKWAAWIKSAHEASHGRKMKVSA